MAVEEPAPGGAVKLFNRWTFEDVQVPTTNLSAITPPPLADLTDHGRRRSGFVLFLRR
jgi:hypothetical protein